MAGFGKTSDFSSIAAHYDATRDVPRGILRTLYVRLAAGGALTARGAIADVGCGAECVEAMNPYLAVDVFRKS
jgi:hypothetical protein